MSQTFSLTCDETKQKIWVGQGWGLMTNFYSGEPETMRRLGEFLRTHEGKPIKLLCDDKTEDMLCEFEEFMESDEDNRDITRTAEIAPGDNIEKKTNEART